MPAEAIFPRSGNNGRQQPVFAGNPLSHSKPGNASERAFFQESLFPREYK
jgi:hypothetical protein